MAVAKSLPKATEDEIQSMERGYWRDMLHRILSDWRLYLLFLPLFFFLVCWKYFPIASMIVSFKDLQIDSSFGGGTFTSDFIALTPSSSCSRRLTSGQPSGTPSP